jgi:hypothetical protein
MSSSKKKIKSKGKDSSGNKSSSIPDEVTSSGSFKVLFGKSGGMGHTNRVSLNPSDMSMLSLKSGAFLMIKFDTGAIFIASAYSSSQTMRGNVAMSKCWQTNFCDGGDRNILISRDINHMVITTASRAVFNITGDVHISHLQSAVFRSYIIAALQGSLLRPGVSMALTWKSSKIAIEVCIIGPDVKLFNCYVFETCFASRQ